MAENLVLGPILARSCPNLVPKVFLSITSLLDVISCCKLSLYAISRKTNQQNLRKRQKKLVFGLGCQIFFFFFQKSGSVSHYFPVNFAKFLRTVFLQNTSKRLLLYPALANNFYSILSAIGVPTK